MNPLTIGNLVASLKSASSVPITPANPSSQDAAAMKIDPARTAGAARGVASGGEVRRPESAGAPADPPADSPVLRSRADAGGPQPFDSARVATLREAVAEGRYQPDGGAIADALIALESDLGGVRR